MGNYGFTGKGALWQQVYKNQREMDKSSQTNDIANHTETGDLQCPTAVVSTPEKVSSTENNLADCLSRVVVAVVKYREKYICHEQFTENQRP